MTPHLNKLQLRGGSDSHLPHRFRESQFRRYEPIISRIVSEFPNAVTFKPNLSPETFTCRLRDIMRAHHDIQWKSDIPYTRFHQIYNYITVAQDNSLGLVYVGGRAQVKAAKGTSNNIFVVEQQRPDNSGVMATVSENSPPQSKPSGLTLIASDASPDVLRAIAVLHHHRIITETTTIVGTLPNDMMAELRKGYDIAVEIESDKVRIL